MTENKDGSTNIDPAERRRVERIPDGASAPGRKAEPGADTASGGPPDDPASHRNRVDPESGAEEDGTPVENPSG